MNQILTFTIKLLIVFYKKSISPLLRKEIGISTDINPDSS